MRLFSGKLAPLSEEITKALVDAHDIECGSKKEVAKDIEAVFTNYLQIEREVTEKAQDLVRNRGLPFSEVGRIKKVMAEQKGIKLDDELLDFLLDQLLEILMHSGNVDEIFVEDHVLKKTMRPLLRKHGSIEDEVETEVRGKMKHVQEGSRNWEVEYKRITADVQRRKGLT